MGLNKVQQAAKELIKSDAQFIQSLFLIHKEDKRMRNNYITMFLPYLGLFTDGSEQWARKLDIVAHTFTGEEKEYYKTMRLGIKIFDSDYNEFNDQLKKRFKESDDYFGSKHNFWDMLRGFYFNIGVDTYNGKYCGNTLLCSLYTPFYKIGEMNGDKIRKLSEVAGKLTVDFNSKVKKIKHKDLSKLTYKDFHFNKSKFIKLDNYDGLILFSILCVINYVIEFINVFFVDEIPQKLKYAYIIYYYLCVFLHDLNEKSNLNIMIDKSLYNPKFRNCLAHYGLGQFINESELINNDLLKGLTQKAFNLDYEETKKKIYSILRDVVSQIESIIF